MRQAVSLLSASGWLALLGCATADPATCACGAREVPVYVPAVGVADAYFEMRTRCVPCDDDQQGDEQ